MLPKLAARLRWPGLVFFAALLPRLADLGRHPLWLDEAYTLQRASLPAGALVRDAFYHHHLPSYFLLLAPFTGLGDPQFWLRLPSAAFGALAVMLVYLITASIAGRLAGLLAALVLGLSPAALAFAQEARSYTLEMCLVLVALQGITLLALDIPRAGLPWRHPGAARAAWALFIGGSVAAVDVLGDGLFWLAAANIIFAVLLWQSASRLQLLRNCLLANAIIAALCLPFYLMMLHWQHERLIASVMWIPALNFERFWYSIASVYLMRIADSVSFGFMPVATPDFISHGIGAALLLAVALAGWRLRRRPALLAALGISFLLLPTLLTIASFWRPIVLPRYILWSAAPFAMLAGIGAAEFLKFLPRRAQFAACAAMAAILLANTIPYYGAETKPRWDIAAKLLAQDVAPGDAVLFYDTAALAVTQAYLPASQQSALLAAATGDFNQARAMQAQGRRVWAVFGTAGQSAAQKAWPNFYAQLAPLGTPEQIQVAGKRIYIALYEPAARNMSQTCISPEPATPKQSPATAAPGNGCG
jgi:4-amino-4-deoxy-L-arabinose transferase-like glycosyltransferase